MRPPSVLTSPRVLVVLVLGVVALLGPGCGDGGSDLAEARADQAREAARNAGLDDEIADFLALAARGSVATHQVTYPGPSADTQLVVASRPPDRRVDLVVDGEVREVRLVVDGAAFTCIRDQVTDRFPQCDRVDAIAEPPGRFDPAAVDELAATLRDRRDDFSFTIETRPVAGVEATCLVTRILAGRARPELGDGATLCLSPEGVLVLVDQAGERLEATDYTTAVPDGTFTRPDDDPEGR